VFSVIEKKRKKFSFNQNSTFVEKNTIIVVQENNIKGNNGKK